MTVYGRDASNFDGSVDYSGLAFFTHKATEGISVVHDRYAARLTAARDAGVPVLGAYHVLRSPSAADGSYADQLRFWIGYLDAHTPWWRTHPHFMLQIDAERWPYDNVTPAEVLAFAGLVAGSGLPGWAVTYASRGQYGDSLTGIRTPLWNANYSGGPNYPGDGWQPGWAPYSGQTPVLLQYTSAGYDHNAYRGNLAQLLALVGGTKGTDMTQVDGLRLKLLYENWSPTRAQWIAAGGSGATYDLLGSGGTDGGIGGSGPNQLAAALGAIHADVKATQSALAALGGDPDALAAKVAAALVASNANGLTQADHDAVKADIVAVLNTVHLTA